MFTVLYIFLSSLGKSFLVLSPHAVAKRSSLTWKCSDPVAIQTITNYKLDLLSQKELAISVLPPPDACENSTPTVLCS